MKMKRRVFFFRDKHGMMIYTVAVGKHVYMFNFIKKKLLVVCIKQNTLPWQIKSATKSSSLPEAQLKFPDNQASQKIST